MADEATRPRFLCPSPGYDRHFAICEHFGIEMVVVPMGPTGPDMAMVERLVSEDERVKGIWCVPRFANPTGVCYSDDVVERFAALKPAADDFRIYWDNAYAVHDFTAEECAPLAGLAQACERAGNPDLWFMFSSTSKITFAGGGIAAVAASDANLEQIRSRRSFQTIGPDRINQLRHVLFLRDLDGVREHMREHAAILRPKFDLVASKLAHGLDGLGIGKWSSPHGGYFVSFKGLGGTAKRIVQLAKEAGVVLTGAGATYPYGVDPQDSNIRIAPSYPGLEELGQACDIFVLCVKIASLEKLLEQ
jgi:DNA-binding transcriptional MocR family regulator